MELGALDGIKVLDHGTAITSPFCGKRDFHRAVACAQSGSCCQPLGSTTAAPGERAACSQHIQLIGDTMSADHSNLVAVAVVSRPWLAMMLGEMGAEVIKIETPHGRDTAADVHHGTPVHYHGFNRGRRNIALDSESADMYHVTVLARNLADTVCSVVHQSLRVTAKTDAGREAVRKLVANSDVYMQNMRPGVAEKMGLGYEDLIKINPDLIYCSISGFGDYGPCTRTD